MTLLAGSRFYLLVGRSLALRGAGRGIGRGGRYVDSLAAASHACPARRGVEIIRLVLHTAWTTIRQQERLPHAPRYLPVSGRRGGCWRALKGCLGKLNVNGRTVDWGLVLSCLPMRLPGSVAKESYGDIGRSIAGAQRSLSTRATGAV